MKSTSATVSSRRVIIAKAVVTLARMRSWTCWRRRARYARATQAGPQYRRRAFALAGNALRQLAQRRLAMTGRRTRDSLGEQGDRDPAERGLGVRGQPIVVTHRTTCPV